MSASTLGLSAADAAFFGDLKLEESIFTILKKRLQLCGSMFVVKMVVDFQDCAGKSIGYFEGMGGLGAGNFLGSVTSWHSKPVE